MAGARIDGAAATMERRPGGSRRRSGDSDLMEVGVMANNNNSKVSHYKYLGSWITDDGRCEEEIRTRIGMAKAAFWQNKEVMRGNIRFCTKMMILNCYVFCVLNYGCESWTWNKAVCKKLNAFEMWCYRRLLKIRWRDKITNEEVLRWVHEQFHFVRDMRKRKLEYAGHVLRESSGESHLYLLEGKISGKKGQR